MGRVHIENGTLSTFWSLGTVIEDAVMGEWLLNLPIPWMTFIIFAATYLVAACVYLVVVRLAVSQLPYVNVHYGSLADITARSRHVRFTPNNGHWTAHLSQLCSCAFMSTGPRRN